MPANIIGLSLIGNFSAPGTVSMRIYHGKDLRKGRTSEPGRPYLVTTVTRERCRVFTHWRTGRLVVDSLRRIDAGEYANTLAWVIMPDHLHWLVVPGTESLEAVVRRLKSDSARCVNRAAGSAGPLWQKGYHDHAVRQDEDVQVLARHIVANPLRAGIVEQIGDYPLWDCIYL